MTDSERIELPQLFEGLLGEGELRDLFRDWALVAQVREVRWKRAPEAHAEGEEPSLTNALDALVQARISGVQVLYTHGSANWIDTVIRVPDGFRIVRMQGVS